MKITKIFDKYFQPYAEYCIRTAFSEEKLKKVLAEECPATSDVPSWQAFKAAIGLSQSIFFSCKPDNPLQLRPVRGTRNTSRGEVFIQCEKVSEQESILHIVIAREQCYKWLLYVIFLLALFWGIAASFVVWWAIFFPLLFWGIAFAVLECCKEMAEAEVPQIRTDLECLLRALERKYSGER